MSSGAEFPYRILPSALEHGVTERDIQYVLLPGNPMTRFYILHDDAEGNGQEMAVGYTERERLIEIAICYRPNETVIFHADSVTLTYKEYYEAEP
jgi:hypothetical protein